MKNTILVVLSLFSFATFSQVKKSKKINEKKIEVVEIKKMDSNEPVMDIGPARFEEPQDKNIIYTTSAVDLPPQYPGGMLAFAAFLSKNIVISEEMKSEDIRAKVYASFIVEKDGSITDIKILRDFGFDSGKEAIRVLKMMPKWIPAQMIDKKVRCTYTVPITFDATK